MFRTTRSDYQSSQPSLEEQNMTGAAATQKSEACVFLLFWEAGAVDSVISFGKLSYNPFMGCIFLFSTDPRE